MELNILETVWFPWSLLLSSTFLSILWLKGFPFWLVENQIVLIVEIPRIAFSILISFALLSSSCQGHFVHESSWRTFFTSYVALYLALHSVNVTCLDLSRLQLHLDLNRPSDSAWVLSCCIFSGHWAEGWNSYLSWLYFPPLTAAMLPSTHHLKMSPSFWASWRFWSIVFLAVFSPLIVAGDGDFMTFFSLGVNPLVYFSANYGGGGWP